MGRGKVKGGKPEDHDQLWTTADHENALFEKYYRASGIVPASEWDAFLTALRSPLPTTFWINQLDASLADHLVQDLQQKWIPELQRLAEQEATSSATTTATVTDSTEPEAVIISPPKPLPWYPNNMGWGMDVSRRALKKYPALREFHQYVMLETAEANFLRQEAVSMIPPLFMDAHHDSIVLDMCAAPGSKTIQLLEMLGLAAQKANQPAKGVVIANDMEFKRCEVLVTQTQRMSRMLPNMITINHDGRMIPNLQIKECRLQFDRILCDAVCSGDGTLRKSPDLWRKWCPRLGHNAHKVQIKLLDKSMKLCKLGGRIVYSTCSMNPVEDEAVVLHSLLRARGRYQLCDTANSIPGLHWSPGLNSWSVMAQDGQFLEKFDQAEAEKKHIWVTMFPLEDKSLVQSFHLERCMRFLPHHQNTGGFFVAVLEKVRDDPDPSFEVPACAAGSASAGTAQTASKENTDNDGVPPLPEDDTGVAEDDVKAPKGNVRFRNQSLTDYFIPAAPEVIEELRSKFEFDETFPFDQLMHRERACPKKLYFMNAMAKDLLNAMHSSDKTWRVVGAGVRIFEKSGPKSDEHYRIAHEGLTTVLPFMPSHRVVNISHGDLVAMLRIPSRSSSILSVGDTESREALKALQARGGGPVILRCIAGAVGKPSGLLVSARITGPMMYLFCPKEDLPQVLHRLGEDPPLPVTPTAKANEGVSTATATAGKDAENMGDAEDVDQHPAKQARLTE